MWAELGSDEAFLGIVVSSVDGIYLHAQKRNTQLLASVMKGEEEIVVMLRWLLVCVI
jgi:hypothetical protein